MATVGLVVHEQRPEAAELARKAAGWLGTRRHTVRLPKDDAEHVGLPELGCPADELGAGLDLAVTLGGDGTILRAVSLVSRAGVPLLGVNLGRLGYLADLEPEGLTDALERVLAGQYTIEERMMLSVVVHRAGEPAVLPALGGDMWAETGVMSRARTLGDTIGPPAENAYAVDPVGVATMRPSAA